MIGAATAAAPAAVAAAATGARSIKCKVFGSERCRSLGSAGPYSELVWNVIASLILEPIERLSGGVGMSQVRVPVKGRRVLGSVNWISLEFGLVAVVVAMTGATTGAATEASLAGAVVGVDVDLVTRGAATAAAPTAVAAAATGARSIKCKVFGSDRCKSLGSAGPYSELVWNVIASLILVPMER
ncbi:hypothetical protein BKA57DRAFT_453182 [Linnemannia elongata]|nr:hypothetical protein BKA57DRAFT_453182 [Linnemannia elongata]